MISVATIVDTIAWSLCTNISLIIMKFQDKKHKRIQGNRQQAKGKSASLELLFKPCLKHLLLRVSFSDSLVGRGKKQTTNFVFDHLTQVLPRPKVGKTGWQYMTAIAIAIVGFSGVSVQAQSSFDPQEVEPMVLPPQERKVSPEDSPSEQQQIPPTEQGTPSPGDWSRVKLIRVLEGHLTTVNSLVFSADGNILISGGSNNDPTLRFWSLNTGDKLDQIRAQRSAVLTLAMSPNGSTLVSSGGDAGINIWDWNTGEYQATFLDHQSKVLSLAITPDSQLLVSGGLDGIRVWTLNPRRPLYRLVGYGNPSYALAINPNGSILASGDGDGRVRFWSLKEAKLVSEFLPHQEQITGIAFTPDGKNLITSSEDRTIKIWDLDTGALLHTLIGHTGSVRSIALNPDGITLASASNDGVTLWNIATGELLNQISREKDWVNSLAFSPDGRLLASGGFDFVIRVWTTAPAPVQEEPSQVDLLFDK